MSESESEDEEAAGSGAGDLRADAGRPSESTESADDRARGAAATAYDAAVLPTSIGDAGAAVAKSEEFCK